MPPDLKLGKKPATTDRRDLKLIDYTVALPPLPTGRFGYGTIFPDWGMLGNDRYGDCVLASGDHQTMLYNRLAVGKANYQLRFTAQNALNDYAAVTGFDPYTGQGDNGTDVREALNYRRRTGLVDASGTRHKIDAYASIPAGDFELALRCIFTFGAVEIGFEVPESAMQQFGRGQVWDDVGDSNIVGGHDVPGVGSTIPGERGTFVTWGRRQFMTRKFFERYNDESWVPLSRESISAAGYNSRHLDWNTLSADLASL
jgi:hypothetical protein